MTDKKAQTDGELTDNQTSTNRPLPGGVSTAQGMSITLCDNDKQTVDVTKFG